MRAVRRLFVFRTERVVAITDGFLNGIGPRSPGGRPATAGPATWRLQRRRATGMPGHGRCAAPGRGAGALRCRPSAIRPGGHPEYSPTTRQARSGRHSCPGPDEFFATTECPSSVRPSGRSGILRDEPSGRWRVHPPDAARWPAGSGTVAGGSCPALCGPACGSGRGGPGGRSAPRRRVGRGGTADPRISPRSRLRTGSSGSNT